MSLLALLADEADARIEAIDELTFDVPGAERALGRAMITDEDANVRAAAATRLGELGARDVSLEEALYDTHPSVRMAACRAIARIGQRTELNLLRRLALEEPIWWVRRAAVIAVARLDRKKAIDLLRAVLDDPFWRVRHAAVRALLALGGAEETDAAITAAIEGSDRASGAVRYLARRLGRLGATDEEVTPLLTAPVGLVVDPDPAVVTARLEQGHAATPAELALYIGDPHASLRAAASRRLRTLAAAGETRALLAASWWLEEPRIPHATASVVKLLDAVGSDELLDLLLADPDARPGAAAWALSFVALNRRSERIDDVIRALDAKTPLVRRTATGVLGTFASRGETARLRALLNDPDEDVRRLAAFGLVQAKDCEPVLALPFAAQPSIVQRLISHAKRERSPEPLDPWAKRAAFLRAPDRLAAARIACTDADAWLRVRAAERLVRSPEEHDRARVRLLSRDPDLAVRAAVRTTNDPALEARAEELMAEARAAGPTAQVPRSDQAIPAPVRVTNGRPLGRTGIVLSPLVLSGANEPSVASLFRAMNEGVNAFFWEPRYRSLTTFLRTAKTRGQTPAVIAGTYHATERAIRTDVERALRRLGRDHLDVFLIFWTRSSARLQDPVDRTMKALRREGLIRAAGFSTHDRALAEAAIGDQEWDVVMVRHSAAHPGAETSLFARAEERGVGVLTFSATSYGRLLRQSATTAAECYRYSLSQRGVTACISAPRGGAELIANLDALHDPHLDEARTRDLRAQGQLVRADSLDFGRFIRRFPALPDPLDALEEELQEADLATYDQLP
jgi:aryl-alcohol dehydrogenase-like predicted oxidoreductase